MDLGEQTYRVKFMIRDRGSNFTGAFDAVLAGAGIRTVLCNVRTPRMNGIAERWIGGCRREILDCTLIWNQDHLRRILHQYGTHHNQPVACRVVPRVVGRQVEGEPFRVDREAMCPRCAPAGRPLTLKRQSQDTPRRPRLAVAAICSPMRA